MPLAPRHLHPAGVDRDRHAERLPPRKEDDALDAEQLETGGEWLELASERAPKEKQRVDGEHLRGADHKGEPGRVRGLSDGDRSVRVLEGRDSKEDEIFKDKKNEKRHDWLGWGKNRTKG